MSKKLSIEELLELVSKAKEDKLSIEEFLELVNKAEYIKGDDLWIRLTQPLYPGQCKSEIDVVNIVKGPIPKCDLNLPSLMSGWKEDDNDAQT